jgi:hypothetical protein
MGLGELLEKVFSALVLLGFVAIAIGLFWRGWIIWQTDEVVELTLPTLITLCVPFAGLLLSREQDPRERRPLALMFGGLGLVLVCGYAMQSVRRENALEMREAAARGASQAASPPPAPPASVSDPTGATVDLSTIMGRAQARANAWQPEAGLLGVEVTQLTARGVQTDAGGSAKFRYGPSPFRPPTTNGSFVVTYDRSGLNGSAIKDAPGKALPEPMCSPEEIYRKVAGENGTKPLTLVYKLDVHGEASWHASDPAAPDVKPQVFDRQNCAPRANSKRPMR